MVGGVIFLWETMLSMGLYPSNHHHVFNNQVLTLPRWPHMIGRACGISQVTSLTHKTPHSDFPNNPFSLLVQIFQPFKDSDLPKLTMFPILGRLLDFFSLTPPCPGKLECYIKRWRKCCPCLLGKSEAEGKEQS